jgi:hypothetical protein
LSCSDEPEAHLVPRLKLDVGSITETTVEDINVRLTHAALFQWTINSSSLVLDWGKPTLQRIFEKESIFPTPYNVVEIEVSRSRFSSPLVLFLISQRWK